MTEPQTIDKPVSLTPEIVRSKMQIVLTKTEQSIQALHDKKKELVFNEDNLEVIKNYLDGCRKINKTVEDERTKMKEPYLQGGRTVDAGAKLISVEVDGLIADVDNQYQKLCKEVAEKQRLAKEAEDRELKIRGEMDTFRLEYSVIISNAKTSAELVAIERLINLETGKASKYFEFLPEFKTSCEPIRGQLTAQKEKVRVLEDLEKQQQEAAKNENDEVFLEIEEKKEQIIAQVEENKVTIQEVASNQAQKTTTSATQVFAKIPTGGRKLWKWRLVDEKSATKSGLTLVVPNEAAIKDILAGKRDSWNEKKLEKVVENGIEYYVDQKF
jgi:hypothetical protein